MDTIFEIDRKINTVLENNVDQETGEITENALAVLNELEISREQKLVNIRNFHANINGMIDANKAEMTKLQANVSRLSNVQAGLKRLLEAVVPEGEKFRHPDTDQLLISWRKSSSLEIDDQAVIDYCNEHKELQDCIEYKPSIKKTELKKHMDSGVGITGAKIKTKNNLQIK